jgi:hypothetical protein
MSKCGVRVLEEECLGLRAEKEKTSRLRSQKRNWLRVSPAAPKLQHTVESKRETLRFGFESARFPLDNMKSYVVLFYLSRPPDCARGGNTIRQRRHHGQRMALR